MKKLSKLKLNVLSNTNLLEREMNSLRGGEKRFCSCACAYADEGFSSSDNRSANFKIGNDGGHSNSDGSDCYWEGYNDTYGYNNGYVCF
jgi:natural product precursor